MIGKTRGFSVAGIICSSGRIAKLLPEHLDESTCDDYLRIMLSTNLIYACQNHFPPATGNALDSQWRIAMEVGFDLFNITLKFDEAWRWHALQRCQELRSAEALEFGGVLIMLDLTDAEPFEPKGPFERLIELLKPADTLEIGLYFRTPNRNLGSPEHDATASALLQKILWLTEQKNITLSLYPHSQCWLQSSRDCRRLIEAVGHPRLRATYSTYHEYATGRIPLVRGMDIVAPWLHRVNFAGATASSSGELPSVSRLDKSVFDPRPVMEHLAGLDYKGPIGTLGCGLAGEPRANLEISLKILRGLMTAAA